MNTDDVINTTQLCSVLGLQVTSEFIRARGISPAFAAGKALFWRKSDVPAIAMAVAKHCSEVADKAVA